MRIGLMGGVAGGSSGIDGAVQAVVNAEAAGLDNFWLPHLPSSGYNALTLLALAGRMTSKIEVGTAVVPTYPHHPTMLAQHAMTAQAALSGRLTLGIGVSHRPFVEDVMGLSYDGAAQHMREYLSVLRPLIDDGSVSFQGDHFKVNASLNVPDARPCSVLIAALAPRMLRIAGELADGTITWMAGLKTVGEHIVPRISRAAEAAGRTRPRVCVGLPVAVTDDVTAAREHAGRTFEGYGRLTNYRRMLDIEGGVGPAEVAVVGNEAEVERQLRAFAGAGATDFMVSVLPVDGGPEASARRTMELVSGLVGTL